MCLSEHSPWSRVSRVCYDPVASSTTSIFSSVSPYKSYTKWSMCRSIASIWRWILVLRLCPRALYITKRLPACGVVSPRNPHSEHPD